MSIASVTRSRVVPGTSVTIARDAPASALNRLDLPDVRLADDRDLQTFANQPAAARVAEQRGRALEQIVDRRRQRARLDEVITLVRKIDRRLEPRDQIEQRRVDRGDGARQRAVELIERRARLQRRRPPRSDRATASACVQIDPPVQKRAQRELARLGEPRAGVDAPR